MKQNDYSNNVILLVQLRIPMIIITIMNRASYQLSCISVLKTTKKHTESCQNLKGFSTPNEATNPQVPLAFRLSMLQMAA